jgi:uroporphyrinogen decarboxylase
VAESEHRLIRALFRQPVDRTPVWIMRQAGRYLPEYLEVRKKAKDFLTLCKTPELACQVTLQPLSRFPLDAAIIFSDILTIPDAFNMGLYFAEGEGPRFLKPICNAADIVKLPDLDPEIELRYVMDAIRMAKRELNNKVPLIGFAGSPWTIATYMIEGQSSKSFSKIKKMLYSEPKLLHQLLSKLSTNITRYINAQIMAGADAVMLFDTWGGILSYENYLEFSLQYMEDIVKNTLRVNGDKKVPIILFTKNSGQALEAIAATGCDALGIDWTTSLSRARHLVGMKVALQGNLDPAVLYAEPDCIQKEVNRVLAEYGSGSGHVFNLGHGINPDTDPEKLATMINAVHTESTQYHKSSPEKLLGKGALV